jgi:hypothetical protein
MVESVYVVTRHVLHVVCVNGSTYYASELLFMRMPLIHLVFISVELIVGCYL